MPYQKSPNYSTYETKRFGFNYDIESRDASKVSSTYFIDAYIENALIEHTDKDLANPTSSVKNRPGCSTITSVTTGVPRGCFNWNINGSGLHDLLYVVGNKLYSSATGSTAIYTLNSSYGTIGWCEFLYDNGNRSVILSDGFRLYIVDSAYSVTVVVPFSVLGVPKIHIPNPIFMDGYLFVAKGYYSNGATADIYNSALNDPTTGYTTFISAEMYPDSLVALSKNNNYIYAIGNNSVEFFYDAGLTNTSPLQRYGSAVLQVGVSLPFANTIVPTDKEVFFVGNTGDGTLSVWRVEGFKPEQISTPVINRLLPKLLEAFYAAGSSIDLTAYELKLNGHKLYVISFPGVMSLVYDVESKVWYKWTTNTGSGYTPTNYIGVYGAADGNGYGYVQDSTGQMNKVDDIYSSDGSASFTTNLTTVKFDFDTFNKKSMSRLTLLGRETGTNYNTYSVSYSDDDYKTWSTPRTITFSNDFPTLNQWGMFRRRAFRVSVNNTQPWTLDQAEVEINKGSQ